MANTRIRLSPQTIDSVDRLGQQCGIEDQNTLIQLLIRKYGTQLVTLLSPTDPSCPELGQAVPMIAKPDPIVMVKPTEPIVTDVVEPSLPDPSRESPANDFLSMDF